MKIYSRRFSFILPLLMFFAALFIPAARPAEASIYYYFNKPADGAVYKAGEEIPVSFYAGVSISTTTMDAWGRPESTTYETMPAQLKVFKGSTELASFDFEYTKPDTIETTYTPDTTGKLKLKIYGRNYGLGNTELVEQDTITITVKKRTAAEVASVKPKISVERIAKKKAEITCTNDSGYGMMVYRSLKKNGKYELVKTVSKATYTDTKLAASKVYYYKVRLFAKKGKKTYLSKWSAKTQAEKYSGAKIKLSGTSKGVKITWKAIKGAGYYLVGRNTDGTDKYDIISCEGSETTSFVDKDAKKGKTYYYAIIAEKDNAIPVGKYIGKQYKIKVK